MRVYFLASQPCALYIGGVYLGAVSDFERYANLELTDNLPVRFECENALPVCFFLQENIIFSPPERCEVYLLKDGIAIYAKDFAPVDFTLRPIAQAKNKDCVATVFAQGDIQLSLQTEKGVFVATLPPCFANCKAVFWQEFVLLDCQDAIAVFNQRAQRLLVERVLSYQVEEDTLTAVLPLSDRYKRVAHCAYRADGENLLRTEYTLSQEGEKVQESLLAYAFFESIRIGAPCEQFLDEELLAKANNLKEFLGNFLQVIPTEKENACLLVYQKAPRLYDTKEFTVTVQNNKITEV